MATVYADYVNDGDSEIYVFVDNSVKELNSSNPVDGPPNVFLKSLLIENGGITPGQYLFSNVTEKAVVVDNAVPALGPMGGYRCPTGGLLNYDRAGYTDLFVGH